MSSKLLTSCKGWIHLRAYHGRCRPFRFPASESDCESGDWSGKDIQKEHPLQEHIDRSHQRHLSWKLDIPYLPDGQGPDVAVFSGAALRAAVLLHPQRHLLLPLPDGYAARRVLQQMEGRTEVWRDRARHRRSPHELPALQDCVLAAVPGDQGDKGSLRDQ